MMPRDMELIRELMLRFEQGDKSLPPSRTQQEVAYHVELLIEKGLLKGHVMRRSERGHRVPHGFIVQDITWEGHDFIKAVKEDGVWQKVKKYFQEKSVPLTVDLVMDFLKSGARTALGI